jgi:hypothetical protein
MPLYSSSYLRTLPRERHTHCTRVTNLVSLSSQRRVWYAPTGRPNELEVLDVTNKTTALFGGYGALLVGAGRSPAHYCTCVVACVTDSGIRERGWLGSRGRTRALVRWPAGLLYIFCGVDLAHAKVHVMCTRVLSHVCVIFVETI